MPKTNPAHKGRMNIREEEVSSGDEANDDVTHTKGSSQANTQDNQERVSLNFQGSLVCHPIVSSICHIGTIDINFRLGYTQLIPCFHFFEQAPARTKKNSCSIVPFSLAYEK